MYTKPLPTPLRLAQAIGITTSIFAASFSFTYSYILIPRLLESPPPLAAKQWRSSFFRGKNLVAPLAVTSAVTYLYLSYRFFRAHAGVFSGEWKVNALAGLLMIGGSAIYTPVVLGGVNGKLLRKAEEMEGLGVRDEVVEVGLGEETTRALVDRWGILNLGRAAIFGVAGLAGTYAALA